MRIYMKKLEGLKQEFVFFPEFDGEDIALLRFPLILKNEEKRDCTLAELKKRGLGATGMYPLSLNEQNGVTPYLPGHESYPHAKFISQRILTLPLHEHVRIEDINLICEIIEKSEGSH
jgi:dTDP-4-amino-4,6-dideoxygalactose transaminase